jgi:hypothetical protein
MAEPKIMVSLTHEQWQWVMSLVLNSAYLRARPIVEAVEAAVGQHTEDMNAAATRERSQREEIVGQLYTAQRELQQGKREITNLKQQVAGYLQAAKRAKRAQRTKGANGHDPSAEIAELRDKLGDEQRRRSVAEEWLKKARAEWRAALGAGADFPEKPPVASVAQVIEVEAELADPLEQADDHG